MKSKLYAILFIVISTFSGAAAQNINWLTGNNPGPFGLNKMEKVVSSTDVWVSGDRGYLVKTSDNGANWTQYTIDSGSDLVDIAAQGRRNLYTVGSDGKAYYSQDFGENWSEVVINSGSFESPVRFNGIEYAYQSFSQPGHFIAIAEGTSKGLILKSAGDGSCTNCTQELTVIAELNEFPKDIFFHSYYDDNLQEIVNRTYIVGSSGLSIYSDDYFSSSTAMNNLGATESLSAIAFSTDFPDVGFVGATGAIYGTRDGGETWAKQSSVPWSVSTVTDIAFQPGSNTAYATAVASTTTTTSFYSKLTQSVSGFNSPISYIDENGLLRGNELYNSIGLFSNNFFTIFSGNGIIARSTDGGTSWAPQNTELADPQAMEVVNNQVFVSYGKNTSIKSSGDNGSSWADIPESFTSDPNNQIDIIKLIDNNGAINGMAATALAGNFFDASSSTFGDPIWAPNGTIRDIDINLWGTHWFTGNSAVFRASSDFFGAAEINMAGTGFQVGTNTDAYGIDFIDENIGYLVGPNGFILKTSNNAADWTTQSSGTTDDLQDVGFFDASKGVVLIDKLTNAYLYTTDGGDNWTSKLLPATANWQEIVIIDANQAYAYGQDGKLIATSDAGNSWNLIDIGYNGDIVDMSYDNSQLYGLVEGGFVFSLQDKLTQNITFGEVADKEFGDEPFTIAASSSSGLPVTFEATGPINLEGNTVTITGVGQASITVSQNGNSEFNAAEPVVRIFTITKGTDIINFPALVSAPWNAENIDLTSSASSASGRAITWASSDGSVATVGETSGSLDYKAPGETTITASIAEDDHWLAATVERTLTVTKAEQSIDFPPIPDKIVGDAPFLLEATATSGFSPNFEIVSGPASLRGREIWNLTQEGEVVVRASLPESTLYFAADPVDQTFNVTSPTQTITFDEITDKTFGDAPFTVTATASSELPVVITVVSGPVTISGNEVTITGAGEATLAANQPGNDDFVAAEEVRRTFTIAKATQTIEFAPLDAVTFGDDPFTLEASGGASGNDIIFTSSNMQIANIDGNQVAILGAGTIDITASQAASENYEAAQDVVQQLIINKADQTLTFETPGDQVFGVEPFDLVATSDAGLEVQFEVTEGPATVSGSEITITGAGVITVQATQPGDQNFNAATPIPRIINVAKGSQIITAEPIPDQRSDAEPFTVIASSSSNLPLNFEVSGPASNIGAEITLTGEAGTVEVTISQAGDENYLAADNVVLSFEVNEPLQQSINFEPIADKVFGDATFNLVASSTANLPVTFSVLSGPAVVSGTEVTLTGAGEVSIAAGQQGDANYSPAVQVVQTFSVAKANQNIVFQPLEDAVFGDDPITLNAQGGDSGNPVNYESSNESIAVVQGNTLTILGAGTVEITATQAGNENFEAAPPVAQDLVIDKANQEITLEPITDKDISESPIEVIASVNSGLSLTIDVSGPASIQGSILTLNDVGQVNLTVSQLGNENYNAAISQTTTFFVTDASRSDQVINFPTIADKTFGDAAFTLNATTNSNLTIDYTVVSGPISINGNTVTINGAGTAVIAANQSGNSNYNPAMEVTREFAINRASQSITFSNLEDRTFGDAPFVLSATASSQLPISYEVLSGSVSISNNEVTILGAGLVSIRASQGGNNNYLAASAVTRTFEVLKSTQIITVDEIGQKTTLDQDFTISYSASSNLEVSVSIEGPAILAGNTVKLEGNPGTVTLLFSQAGNENYLSAAESVSFEVIETRQSQVITFTGNNTMVYGESLTVSATSNSGLPVELMILQGDASLEGNTLNANATGVVVVEASQPGNNQFLPAEVQTKSITISKAPLVVKADAQTIMYGEDLPGLTYTLNGLVAGDTESDFVSPVQIITGAEADSEPGQYVISVGGAQATNYDISYEHATLIISKGILEITTPDLEITLGQQIPSININYDGFVGDDDESALDQLPAFELQPAIVEEVGTYQIILSGASSELYEIQYQNAELSVRPLTASGIINAPGVSSLTGTGISLLKSNAGLGYTLVDETTANEDGGFTFEVLETGEYTIKVDPGSGLTNDWFGTFLGNALIPSEAATFTPENYSGSLSINLLAKPSVAGNSGNATITGRFVLSEGSNGGRLLEGYELLDAEPIANVEISLVDLATGEIVGTDMTDAEGRYEFSGLVEGEYQLLADYNGVILDFDEAIIEIEGSNSNLQVTAAVNEDGVVVTEVAVVNGLTTSLLPNWKVFPNPASHFIQVSKPDQNAWKMELYNLNGQKQIERILLRENEQIQLELLPKGQYFLRFVSESGDLMMTHKLILK